jgi:hypothetical protein
MDREQNERDWARYLGQIKDREERAFFTQIHKERSEVTLEWREDGQVILHGIGLK